jgi:molybdopterin synthase catalytic subunit
MMQHFSKTPVCGAGCTFVGLSRQESRKLSVAPYHHADPTLVSRNVAQHLHVQLL